MFKRFLVTAAAAAVTLTSLSACVVAPPARPAYGGDADGDGVRNRYDRDRDNDGVRNRNDDRPYNPYRR